MAFPRSLLDALCFPLPGALQSRDKWNQGPSWRTWFQCSFSSVRCKGATGKLPQCLGNFQPPEMIKPAHLNVITHMTQSKDTGYNQLQDLNWLSWMILELSTPQRRNKLTDGWQCSRAGVGCIKQKWSTEVNEPPTLAESGACPWRQKVSSCNLHLAVWYKHLLPSWLASFTQWL